MEILVIDGQGGGLGRQLVAAVKKAVPQAVVRPSAPTARPLPPC